VVRQGHLIAVVVRAFVIGCAVLLIVVGCSGKRSETSKKEQGHTSKKEQGHTEGTKQEQGRCEEPRTFKNGFTLTTNDLPGCPKGGPLSGTDKHDNLLGRLGDDEIRGLGTGDFTLGGAGNDLIYGGPGDDLILTVHLGRGGGNDGRDKLYCGEGRDEYIADKNDYVSSSCEKKLKPSDLARTD